MNPLIALAELVASLDPDGSVPRETLEAMVELAKEALIGTQLVLRVRRPVGVKTQKGEYCDVV